MSGLDHVIFGASCESHTTREIEKLPGEQMQLRTMSRSVMEVAPSGVHVPPFSQAHISTWGENTFGAPRESVAKITTSDN